MNQDEQLMELLKVVHKLMAICPKCQYAVDDIIQAQRAQNMTDEDPSGNFEEVQEITDFFNEVTNAMLAHFEVFHPADVPAIKKTVEEVQEWMQANTPPSP